MTLVVGIKADDGIVLAADGRTSRAVVGGGTCPVDDDTQKIFSSTDGKWGFGMAGLPAAALGALDDIREYCSPNGIRANAFGVAKHLRDEFSEYFGRNKERLINEWPQLSILIVGYEVTGKAAFYCLESSAGFRPFSISDRTYYKIGSDFRCQIVESLLKKSPEPMNVSQAQRAAASLIRGIGTVDGSVGGKIHMAVIDPKGYGEMADKDVAGIEAAVSQIDDHLRRRLWEALTEPPAPNDPQPKRTTTGKQSRLRIAR